MSRVSFQRRNGLVAFLHASARTFAKRACVGSMKQEPAQASLSKSTRLIVRDNTNWKKVELETALIRLAVLLTFTVLIMFSVGVLFLLQSNVALPVLVSVLSLFILMMLFLYQRIVFGYIDYKYKSPTYYATHDF